MVAAEFLQQDFVNLRVRSKDAAHASRRTEMTHPTQLTGLEGIYVLFLQPPPAAKPATLRIASRCTYSDPFLAKVLKRYVTGGQSPAQLLQYRPYFSIRFSKYVESNNGWKCSSDCECQKLCYFGIKRGAVSVCPSLKYTCGWLLR